MLYWRYSLQKQDKSDSKDPRPPAVIIYNHKEKSHFYNIIHHIIQITRFSILSQFSLLMQGTLAHSRILNKITSSLNRFLLDTARAGNQKTRRNSSMNGWTERNWATQRRSTRARHPRHDSVNEMPMLAPKGFWNSQIKIWWPLMICWGRPVSKIRIIKRIWIWIRKRQIQVGRSESR